MESIEKNPGLYLLEGILLIILGTLAIVMPIVSTISVAIILGWVLIIGGIYRFFRSIKLRHEIKHFWLNLILSAALVVLGVFFLNHLLIGIYALTIALGIYFLAEGIFSIIQAMTSRSENYWGALLLNGIITLILGVLVLSGLPSSASWILGLLVGINLVVTGFVLAFTAGSAKKPVQHYGT